MRGWHVLMVFMIAGLIQPASGQAVVSPVSYSVPGSIYVQNFDGLPNSGTFSLSGKGPFNVAATPISALNMAGWQVFMLAGSNANAGFAVATGSSTGNAVYSLGAAASGERALGSLSSSTGVYAMGLVLTNQTGGPLNHFTVNFTAEQWRKGGSGNKNTWAFRYKTGMISSIDQPNLLEEANLNFGSVITTTSAATLVGNQPENQQAVSYTITGINWKAGEQLLLRWDDADETGNDDIVALDNFSFSAGLTPAVPNITSMAVANISTSTAIINAVVNDNYAITAITIEYDTSAVFAKLQSVHPSPDSLQPGSGKTNIEARLSSLLQGKTYYFRVKAQNSLGTVMSVVKNFTTAISPPEVTTIAVSSIYTNTAMVSGNVSGDAISEKGIVWATGDNPSITNNKITTEAGAGNFSQLITGLPQGSTVFARAYAINAGGVAYGETVRIVTQTVIVSFLPSNISKTNAPTVQFYLKTAQPLTGLSPANFEIRSTGIAAASVTAIASNANSFTITVATGTGSGTLSLAFVNDIGVSIPVNNKPFNSAGYYIIDKLSPQIRKLGIPDMPMKIGDTVPVTITVLPDPDLFKMNHGNVNGFGLSALTQRNDSIYTSSFIITSGGIDVDAAMPIPFSISLNDSTGNTGALTATIVQSNDLLDANRPVILSMQNPPKGMYKTGDTLNFVCRFNEKINISNTGIPSITLTIGSRSRTALYAGGNNSDSLLLRYVISQDDFDNDGIKTTSNITLNSATIRDIAGNNALLGFTSGLQVNDILIDAVAPVINAIQVPPNKTHRLGDTLQFVFGFSKGIALQKYDTPSIKLTIGSKDKDLLFSGMIGTNSLMFSYIVEYGDLDKNGISIGTMISSTNTKITDSIGNAANLNFKSPSLSGIKIDAVSPIFSTPVPENVFVCGNGSLTITNAFAISDDEVGELVTWRIKNTPLLGSCSLPAFSLTSTGKNIIPTGIVYKPNANQSGMDTLVTELTDGINTVQKMIIVFIQPSIQDNTISASQLICEEKLPQLFTGNAVSGGSGSYKYGWDLSVDSIRFSAATGINDQPSYQSTFLHSDAWFRRRVFSGACADTSAPIKISIAKNGFWTGTKNSDWNNAGNWCNAAIPNSLTNVSIYADAMYQPQIKDTALCNDILLGERSRLTITAILAISGNIIAPVGSMNFEKGTIICNGSTLQNVNGNCFEKNNLQQLVINNTAGVLLSGDTRISGSLSLTKGWLQTNNHLLLMHDAMIGACASGTKINGNISIQHLIKGGRRSFHFIGHPFTPSIALQMIRDSMDITGENGSLNGFTTTINNDPSAFYYDFNKGNDSTGVEAGWTSFTNTNGAGENAWKNYEGIRLRFNGRPGQGLDGTPPGDGSNGTYVPQSVMLMITGDVNTDEQEITLPKNQYPCYHLVANPYASNIDMSRITKGSGIGNYYWLWNPLQGKHGGYTSYPFGSANTLPVLGAFIARVNENYNNRFLFTEHCKTKTSGDTVPVFKSDDIFFIELRLETGTIFWDRLLLLNMDSARTGFDKNDAEKFLNDDVNFYSISRENRKLSVDARPVNNESLIPIGLQTNENNQFAIRIANAKLPAANSLQLHDKYLNRWLPLEKDSVYNFTTTEDTLSKGDKRFEIAARKEATDSFLTNKNLVMKTYPIPAKHTIVVKYASTETGNTAVRIVDLMGNLVKNIPLGMQKQGQVIIPVTNLPSGIYIVEIRCGNDVSMQKIIKQ